MIYYTFQNMRDPAHPARELRHTPVAVRVAVLRHRDVRNRRLRRHHARHLARSALHDLHDVRGLHVHP